MNINIIVFGFPELESDHHKVMYSYANELDSRGHDVVIYHATNNPHERQPMQKSSIVMEQFRQHILRRQAFAAPLWYKLNDTVVSKKIVDVSNDLIRDAAFIISTGAVLALEVFRLSSSKGFKVNLIQNNEVPIAQHPDLVYDSYRLPVITIALSAELQNLVGQYATEKPLLLNYKPFDRLWNVADTHLEDLLYSSLTYLQRLQYT
jgi:hypothetical protein